tara:strand:+ start:1442 stop:2812 length:1371 start_codon:yes stop_codon:yes gene_type:complete
LIPQKFKKISTLVLLAGPGSGSKLFQSFIDGHDEVLMTPGYILMYFYPHWNKHLKHYNNWSSIINHLLKLHPSIIDTKKLKGGDYLYNLGKNKKKSIKINKNSFKKKLQKFLNKEKINSKNLFLGIHLAYSECIGENIHLKKVLIYHMHVCWYMKYFYKDFTKAKTITMLRELKSNIPKRIPALEKPNELHLNKTDSIFFKTRSYKNIIYEDFFSLDYLKNYKDKSHRVIKHEDLLLRKKKVIKKFCSYTGIRYSKSLLKSTVNNLPWNYQFSTNVNFKQGVAEHILNYNKQDFFSYELFWVNNLINNFNKKYNYEINKKNFNAFNTLLCFFFIFLPSKKELLLFIEFFTIRNIYNYLIALYNEVFKFKLKLYQNNAFYFHKWSNKNYPFVFINFLNVKLNKKKNIIWIIFYIIFKVFLFISIPAVIILEYISRIILCINIYFKNIFGLRFFPKKL